MFNFCSTFSPFQLFPVSLARNRFLIFWNFAKKIAPPTYPLPSPPHTHTHTAPPHVPKPTHIPQYHPPTYPPPHHRSPPPPLTPHIPRTTPPPPTFPPPFKISPKKKMFFLWLKITIEWGLADYTTLCKKASLFRSLKSHCIDLVINWGRFQTTNWRKFTNFRQSPAVIRALSLRGGNNLWGGLTFEGARQTQPWKEWTQSVNPTM